MKKFLHIIFLLLTIEISLAQHITPKQSILAAKNFIAQQTDFKGYKPAGQPITIQNAQNQDIAYVVKLSPAGFIIFSTDQRVHPIKAFTNEGFFDTSSANPLIGMLRAEMSCELNSVLNNKVTQQQIEHNKKLWQSLLTGQASKIFKTKVQYGPSVPSIWGGVNCYDDQGNIIYVGNYYTPNHYSPGCVATSLSQILHRYQWPIHGIGSHTDNDNSGSSTGSYYANFERTFYDWKNMLNEYYHKPSTDIQRRACGLLQYHCGISVDMDYEYNGSTSNINRVPSALSNYWRYVGHYETTSWSQFWPRMDQNMEDGIPVQLAVKADNGAAHAIVVDGYRQNNGGDKYYHLHMGWWGDCDAWYRIALSFNACGYTTVTAGVFDIVPVPELRVADITRTCDNYKVILSWLVSKKIPYNVFELQQSDDGGNTWTTLSNSITDTFYVLNFPRTDPIGKVYKYRVRTNYAGHWYVNSYSNTVSVAITDDLTYLDFDGNDSYYVLDNSSNDLDISDKWTIEAWINVDNYSDNSWSVIMDRRTVFSFYLINDADADYAIRFVARDNSGNIIASVRSDNSSVNMSLHQWYHVAVSYDGSTARLFINGKLVDSSTDPDFNLSSSTYALNIGARFWGSYSRYFDGKMDEIRISDTPRYVTDFTPDRYMRFQPDQHTRLLMHLDEGAGYYVYDASDHFKYIKLRPSPNSPNWMYASYGNRWTGNSSSDWYDASNWTGGVPDAQTLVHISADAANFPVITANTTVKYLKIEDNAKLTVAPGATLTVTGEFCNNGTLILETPQDSTQSAALLDTSLISRNFGQCIAKRFLPCCQYSYISSPVQSATAAQFINIDGNFNPNFYWYDETQAGDDWMNGWTPAYNDQQEPDTLVPMRGYAFYYPYDTLIATFIGTFNKGTYRITTTYTDGSETQVHKGWNLVGNPYPSPIDWDKEQGWVKNNIDNAIYFWNGKNYSYYVGSGGTDNSEGLGINNASNIIPPYTGFMVKASANGYLQVNDRARVSFNHDFYKKGENYLTLIILSLSKNKLTPDSWDETAIRFLPQATAGFDSKFDAYKLFSNQNIPQIYSIDTDNIQLAINTLPAQNIQTQIKLGYRVNETGTYKLQVRQFALPDSLRAILYDKQTQTYMPLDTGTTYTFTSEQGQFDDRFILKIEKPQKLIAQTPLIIYSANHTLYIKAKPSENAKIKIYDLSGKLVFQTKITRYLTAVKLSYPGVYIVRFSNNLISQSKKILIK